MDRPHRRWPAFAASVVAFVLGGAGGVLIGSSGEADTQTVVRTVTDANAETVTETETVKMVKTVTVTETETVTTDERPPPRPDETTDDDEDGDDCSDSYEGACLDPSDGFNDIDCTEISDTDFDSVGDDPYRLDADYDGTACESY